jgi:ribose transport system substrate-binding protein
MYVLKRTWIFLLVFTFFFTILLTGCASKTSEVTQKEDENTKVEQKSPEPAKKDDTQTTEQKLEKKYRIAANLQDLSNPYWVTFGKGITDYCKEVGYEVNLTDGKLDPPSQVASIENFVASGYDAIILGACDPPGISAAVKKAVEKGVSVVCVATPVEGASAQFIVDEYNYGSYVGRAAAKWINEKLGGTAEVAIFDWPEIVSVIQRANGIQETIEKEAPGAKIVARQAALSPETGMKAAETILQAHPNVKVIAGVNDAGVLGALEVVKSMKKDTPDFFIGGLDATEEALAKMKEPGSVYRYTCDLFPYESGKESVKIAVDTKLNGPKSEPMYFPMGDVTID